MDTRSDDGPARFFDSRAAYLLFVTTTNEKAVVADRIGRELGDMEASPPGFGVLDAGMGDASVLSGVMRRFHDRSPHVPVRAVAKEISIEDVRVGLTKLPDLIFEHPETVFVVMTADLSCLKNVRLILETMNHLGYPSSKVQLVLNRSNAFTGINVKNAEGALRRTIDYQIVNEYRGAISALNSGAPFMFGKADSALGGSLLQFAKSVDKAAVASLTTALAVR